MSVTGCRAAADTVSPDSRIAGSRCLTAAGGYVGARASELLGSGFTGAFGRQLIAVYVMTVCARALGTLHYAYEDRIGWTE